MVALGIVGGPTTAQDEPGASDPVRAHWAIDAEYAAQVEAMHRDELAEGIGVAGWSALSPSWPELLLDPQDWDGTVEETGAETALSFIRGRLALWVVVGLERGCL